MLSWIGPQPLTRTMRAAGHWLAGVHGVCRRGSGFRTILLVICLTCVASPASAQVNTHSAGVGWSGSHGGVNWDGGHAYDGGGYNGYPPTYQPIPSVRPMPIQPLQERTHGPTPLLTRPIEPVLIPPHQLAAPKTRENRR